MIKGLVIIPARGGSKGIPRKNVRLLGDKPLIFYSIAIGKQLAASIPGIDVVVSSEDPLILEITNFYGVESVKRPPELSHDSVTLDPVVKHAVECMEEHKKEKYDVIITLQPTSPLLKWETLKLALEKFINSQLDTLISAVEKKHLFWVKGDNGIKPFYSERKNRQFLDPIYWEAGAFLISRRELIDRGTRIGNRVGVFPLGDIEGLDIDQWYDWILAESFLNRRKIVFRVEGDRNIGLGHVYRCLTLAEKFIAHEVTFLMKEELGISKVKEHNFKVVTFSREDEILKIIDEINPDIVINDILDTSEEYVKQLKERDIFIVNFEDLGEGARYADIVFNALYEWSGIDQENVYYGYKYECLRETFYLFPVKEKPRKRVKNILITFGGTDPNDLTRRVLNVLRKAEIRNVLINVILGLGYKKRDEIISLAGKMREEGINVKVLEDVPFISRFMFEADFLITSNGRTVYESVSLGTPAISISQNFREATHLFSRICPGVINLGLATEIDDEDIKTAIMKLMDNYEVRKTMQQSLKEYAMEIRKGIERIETIIFERYKEKRLDGGRS